MVMADAKLLAGDVDAFGRVEIGRVNAQIDVGHERAQQQQAIALFDELRHCVVAHRAFVQADEQRMDFRNDAFAQHRRRDRNLRTLGKR